MQGDCGASRRRICLHLQAGKRSLRGGTASSLGDQRFAGLFQRIGQILPGDGMVDHMGSARMLRGKAALQPVNCVSLFNVQAVLHRNTQGGRRALQPVGLIGPDI